MSLSLLRGAAAAFKSSNPPTLHKLRRMPTREAIVQEIAAELPGLVADCPVVADPSCPGTPCLQRSLSTNSTGSRRSLRKSTTQVFDKLVGQLNNVETAPGAAAWDCPPSQSPWKRIDHIGDGLYICGAAALEDFELLGSLGIRSIVNCAEKDLYTRTDFCSDGRSLADHLQNFRIEVLDAEDVEHCCMSALWERASEFIDESLAWGGVVVHCAMGVSRSSSTCIAYLMLRQRLSLEAAFRRVFLARDHIFPNTGFWQQLRNLEKQLLRCAPPTAAGLSSDADHEDRGKTASQVIALLDFQARQKREGERNGW
eukprot:TRINITY_DN18762_c0_g2_i1.p1 TRINITY_DN18762_c0_g2~~TRINITY_DN18762_c0_g2_i1.p1  ORF type:complete len:313 (-),score=61.56 TRINITY_DN18762_c0_g2_i1:165-1103(-)